MKSWQGYLLIASPRMPDPRFSRRVVLLLQHNAQGALGIVLNQPLTAEDTGPWQLLDTLASVQNRKVQIGGPMAGPLIVLQERPPAEGGLPAAGGVMVVNQRAQLEQLLRQPETDLRFFVGHAGWTDGQLESELAEGAWLLTPAEPEFVFGQHDDMWLNALRQAGRFFYFDVLGISHFPEDVSCN